MKVKPKFLTEVGIIAAIYAALTLILAPISFGPLQVRVSEALCILPFFTPAAIPGLFIGCLIANSFGLMLGTSLGALDIIIGSLATLIAAFLASRIKNKWFVPLPSVIINAVLVSITLLVMLNIPYAYSLLWVGVGQAIACYGIGLPLMLILNKNRKAIFSR